MIEVDFCFVLHVEFGDELVLGRVTAFVVGQALVLINYLLVGLFLKHCFK